MADIYRRASQVVIWLGERSHDSDAAIALAQQLADVANHYGSEAIRNDVGLEKYGIPKRGHKSWMALGTLLKRSWFRRAWVVQEASMAKTASLQCGRSCMSLEDFTNALFYCSISGSRHYGSHLLTTFGSPVNRITYVESYRRHKQEASRPSISPLGVLVLAKSCEATDPRDKLFAFLKIGRLNVSPDYTRSVEELYIDNATNFLQTSLQCSYFCRYEQTCQNCDHRRQLTRILYNAGRLSQKLDLPSWVPDWSHQYTRRPLGWADPLTEQNNCFSAGGPYLNDFEILSGRLLRISVILKDAISIAGTVDISDILALSEKQLQHKFRVWYAESFCMHFGSGLRSSKPYVTGEARPDVFARTLVADSDHRGTSRVSLQYAHQSLSMFLRYINSDGPEVYDLLSPRFERMLDNELSGLYIKSKIIGRVFFLTEQGYVGLAPNGVMPGDEIAIIMGGDLPVAIRNVGFSLEGEKYALLGECYVHGLMDGEALKDGTGNATNIVLV
ncbi:hypothetical protein K469DRAFT_705656 [Zopfia rhizophila CBS 207.26]|uniref:Heterokaryon incompatibility domain-containing protein n=1 Tax=Zopfia rhizophila CBS 207.26 TaxID=1314779 RepID=A0A6A6EAE2_9PEZI|nr:hypothetical protein K469DRAFT_705656 [Zopfia rhizophila CBS 207.26]